jgi:hypothetical protein
MAALGWLLNLGFAGGEGVAPADPGFVRRTAVADATPVRRILVAAEGTPVRRIATTDVPFAGNSP